MRSNYESLKSSFQALYPFELDPFQQQAIDAYLDEGSVLVAAPTGTGKTVVAEFGVHDAWLRGHRVVYTTPIKALSNQKFRDFRQRYGEDVGLLTGDIIENRNARILVMTTEVLRNMLLQSPWEVDDVACVIFDEVHYLADVERGTTWEEAIILCPEHVQLIALSATVSNADEIAAWMSVVHRPTRLITHTDRAVPLMHLYFMGGTLYPALDEEGRFPKNLQGVGGEAKRRFSRRSRGEEREEPQPPDIVSALQAQNLLPAIYFLFSRRDCEAAAELCASLRMHLVRSREQHAGIEEVVNRFLDRLVPEDRALKQVQDIVSLARVGIGFHHAGLLPVLKQLVEELFSKGLMSVVFSTDTLALGINMPARSVVVGALSKFDGQSVRPLIPNEFQQMAGRAGRRGIDVSGYVVIPYSKWVSFRDSMDIATGQLYPVNSAFALRYNTVMNLWEPPRGDRVLYILRESLMQYQMSRRVREISTEVQRAQERYDAIDRGCLIGYEDGEELLTEFVEMNHTWESLKRRRQRLAEEGDALRARLESTPWRQPTREAIRKLLRSVAPGLMLHVRGGGWKVYAGRDSSGTALVLDNRSLRTLQGYSEIDYSPSPDLRVHMPSELLNAIGSGSMGEVGDATWEQVETAVAELDLPDLVSWAERHRERVAGEISPMLERNRSDLEDAVTRAEDAARRVRDHVCSPCPVRKKHRSNLREASRVQDRKRDAERELQRTIQQEEVRAQRVLGGIASVLHKFGYLEHGVATDKADLLANVFDTNGLIICEVISRGMLDALSPADLAEVFSWFAYDRDRQFGNRHVLPRHMVFLRRDLNELQNKVLLAESKAGFHLSEGYNPYFFGIMRAWCHGAPLADLLDKAQISEGDIVLTLNKAVDLMRQVREMLLSVGRTPDLAERLSAAMRMARRGIIEQSYVVGFGLPTIPADASDEDVEDMIASSSLE